MTHLDRNAVTEILERVVAEKGSDYLYERSEFGKGAPACTYSNQDGTPSCIVGHVLAELLPETFAEIRDAEWERGVGASIAQLSGSGIEEYTGGDYLETVTLVPPLRIDDNNLVHALGEAQRLQDDRETWGTALAAYYTVIENG